MPVIKIRDIAYGRLRAPDLDLMEEFLTNFGMVKVERTPRALYMRGSDPAHHIHVTEKGEPGLLAFAYEAASADDLQRLAREPGASAVETMDEPGGGKRVRIREPNGYEIEVVHGIAALPAIAIAPRPLNTGMAPLNRAGTLMRVPRGPSQVKRIAHGVLCSPDVRRTVTWFRDTLGMIQSDDLYAGSRDNLIGSFNRADCGEDYVDHHVFFCLKHGTAGLNHLSFEVQDVDDVFVGHEHLKTLGKYRHMWGIGRHLLGSQIFDYWLDPWGQMHEHWTDSDRLNARSGSHEMPVEQGFVSQWGEAAPPRVQAQVSP